MPFLSGRVSYLRLRVTGDAPAQVDDAFLDILASHSFKESPAPRVGTPEVGFCTGVHLLDSQFSYEKNAFGTMAHFSMRVDNHQVPGDVKKAARIQNEQAAAAASASGFASRADKADAKDQANREVTEQLASGKYRKSKVVPVLWDLSAGLIYCAAASDTVVEELAKIMREAFAVKLQPLSAGARAAEIMSDSGSGVKAFDDLRPSAFTPPPAGIEREEGEAPDMHNIPGIPWAAKARDLRDFLGNEFLMWMLWKSTQGHIETPESFGVGSVNITPWKRLEMDCAWAVTGKTTIRLGTGDEGASPLRTPECGRALAAGKWPRKMGMMVSNGENAYELTLQGDQFLISAATLPDIEQADSDRELQDARVESIRDMDKTLDAAFAGFLALRVSPKWDAETVPAIREWIVKRG
jgi:hypothetical protein